MSKTDTVNGMRIVTGIHEPLASYFDAASDEHTATEYPEKLRDLKVMQEKDVDLPAIIDEYKEDLESNGFNDADRIIKRGVIQLISYARHEDNLKLLMDPEWKKKSRDELYIELEKTLKEYET